jgi:hypothetical protein
MPLHSEENPRQNLHDSLIDVRDMDNNEVSIGKES